ncbi:MAG: LacI family DNA-binding transcriptional regulator [Finegoldia sp.]|nr:LacI family DNA-binding transcriptional regulator [Finegoldia sp.]
MSAPTIKDVAKLAGVSISTVSRVMNDSKPVSPESRRKVEDAIKKLDFKPNELARSLVMKRSNLIGVVVEDIGISYMAQIVRGVEEIGRMYKYDILLSSTYGDLDQEKKIIEFMFSKQVEGIILISENINPEVIFKLRDQGIPYIQLGRFSKLKDYRTVRVDYEEAFYNLVEYLSGLGHEKILFIKDDTDLETERQKLLGYKKALEKFGLKPYIIEVGGANVEDGYEVGEKVIKLSEKKGVTCVCFRTDSQAIGFLNYCYDNNLKVPDKISVTGFGDFPMTSIYRPTLTTVQVPYYDIGAISMRSLVKILQEDQKMTDEIVLGSQIMKRDTVKKLN